MRRRYVRPGEVPVTCSGRFGPRRVRVTECAAVVTAEDVYTSMLERGEAVAPGLTATGTLIDARGVEGTCRIEVRPNQVWRRGRVFFVCGRCNRRCTRLYRPTIAAALACRRCWGLSYQSRQEYNYKASGPFGFSSREIAYATTYARREERSAASRARWLRRRALVEARVEREQAAAVEQERAERERVRRAFLAKLEAERAARRG